MVTGSDLFVNLFNNLAIFIILIACYGFWVSRRDSYGPLARQFVVGLSFGVVTIICMHVRIQVAEGVLVDQRNTIVTLSGAFGGPLAAVICGLLSGGYRAYLGGSGVLGGVIGISLSAICGICIYLLRDKIDTAFKAVVAAAAATILILPGFLFVGDLGKGWELMKAMTVPYGLAVFVGLLFIGLLLAHEEHRHIARNEHRKSEERFRAIFNSAFQFTGLLTHEGIVVEANQTALDFVGTSQAEVVGKPFWETPWWGGDRDLMARVRKAVHQAASGEFVRFEAEHLGANGFRMSLDFSLKPIFDQSGRVVLLLPEGRDITERKAVEEALRANQDRLKLAQEIAHIGNWELDLSTGQIWASEEAFRIYGLELNADQKLPLEVVQAIPLAEERPRLGEAMQRLLHAGVGYDLEFCFRRVGDGEIRYAESKAKLIKGTGDVGTMVLGTIQDITDRKNMEHSLRLTQSAFDSASIGIFRVGDNGQILSVNNQACQSLQYSKEELLKMSVFDIDPAFPRDSWEGHINDLREVGNKYIQTTHRRKNGETFPVEIIINFLRFGDEAFHLAFVRDVTERLELEAERAHLEAQLAQSQKMEAIGIMAGGIAHDFNNILTAIIGYTELAQHSCRQKKETFRALEQVLLASERAHTLVRQILTFSRKSETEKKLVNINEIITTTLSMLRRTISKMVSIETNFASGIPPVVADPGQMEQVVMNLAVNSSDAMPDGGRLLVETQVIELDSEYAKKVLDIVPGPYLVITFSDTGHGMDSETVRHIFEPFFSTKEPGKGTGLGLSTVYGITKGHGGRITVYSELGVGTVFKIYLPLRTGEAVVADETPTYNEADLRGGETILIVDDEEVLRELGRETLTSMGYKVLTADSGEAALATYQELGHRLDLVILDLGMPGMGGKRCLEELLSINPEAKIVIASGYSANGQVKASLASGASGFLPKPFRFVELLSSVRSALDKK